MTMKTTSIPVFAGQGSLALFTPKARTVATKDSSSASGSLLLKAAYHAFISELASLPKSARQTIGIDLDDFPTPESLLEPKEKYQSSCVIQGTILCLFQLLRYLSYVEETPDVSFDTASKSFSEVAGFCSGSLAAAVVATSHTTVDFLSHSVEAFKLALWIGYEAELYRLSERPVGEKEMLSWGLVVFGWTRETALEHIAAYNKKASTSSATLHLTAVSAEKVVSISGRGDILARFQIEEVAGKFSTRFTNVHTLYHGGATLQGVKTKVQAHLTRRHLKFPSLADAKIPMRSTVDGRFLSQTSGKSLLELVLDMVLIECVNWDKTVERMLADALRIAEKTKTSVINFGPGTGSVFQAQKPPHRNIALVDVSHTSDAATAFASAKPLRFKPEDGIAIIGMGVNMPGATNIGSLWEVLEQGLNTVSEIPKSRFDVSTYYDPSGDANKPVRSMGTKFGNFLENPAAFDNSFFNISPREAKSLDPQQRVLLQTAYTAIENAGYVADSTDTFARESFGCYVGVATGDYVENLRDDIDVYYSTGNLRAFLSGRISYALKLSGPSLVVDTACSSSLIAIYQACRALEAGDCNAAVAGGVNVITSPDMYLGLDRAHFLSPTGQCKAFDESADGYCRSEGCGMFVLKRLSDAIAENDQILGVIRGVQVNQSGEAHSITHPHSATQQVLFNRLLKETGVDPLDISVIEAHGTGTQAGDPAELASLRGTFAKTRTPNRPLHITSVKANIGHCEAASGAAGLAKLLLMLRHKTIPKQISLKNLNPKIAPLGTDGVEIARSNVPWKAYESARRLALLNNFGAAGSNGVLLLEEAPDARVKPDELTRKAHPFAFSAKNKNALENLRKKYINYIRENKDTLSLEDVCYTATARRQPFNHRIAVTATSFDGLISELEKAVPKQIPAKQADSKTVFVFSGQGSQFLGMGRSLLQTSSVFREIVEQAHSSLVGLGFVGVFPIMNAVNDVEPDITPEQRVEAFQCTIFVLEYALAKLWISFGVQPDAVLGHSLGEYAALAIAEVITFSDALKIVANRARMMADLCKPSASGMLAVNAPPEKVEGILKSRSDLQDLTVACRNSTSDCVVAGALEQVDILRAYLKENSIAKCMKLDVPYGYHSAAMDPILEPLTALAGSVKISAPKIITGSNVLGRIVNASDINGEYFAQHARQTVRFAEEIQEITSLPGFSGNVRYIEIGPNPISLPMVRSTISSSAAAGGADFIPSMHKTKDPWVSLADSLCGLYLSGFPAKWREVYAGSLSKCIDIPSYPFEDKEFWIAFKEHAQASEDKEIVTETPRGAPTGYTMLATCLQLPAEGVDGIFETPLAQLGPSITGHQVGGAPLCPASVYHELALASAAFGVQATRGAVHSLSKIKYSHALVFEEGTKKTVRITTKLDVQTGESTFAIVSYTDNLESAQLHCTGELKQSLKAAVEHKFTHRALKLERSKHSIFSSNGHDGPETIHTRMLYEVVFPRVVTYSKQYQTVKSMTISQTGDEGYAVVRMPAGHAKGKYVVDPVFMDTLLHAAGFIANSAVSAEEACICAEVGTAKMLYDEINYEDTFGVYCSVVFHPKDNVFVADAYATNPAGKIVGSIKGMHFKKVKLGKFRAHLAHILGKSASPAVRATTPVQNVTAKQVTPVAHVAHVTQVTQVAAPVADIIGQVARCIADVCGVGIETVTSSTEMEALGVDSLMIFEIADKLKATFSNVSIESSELAACHTVKDLEDAISKRMPAQTSTPPPPVPQVAVQKTQIVVDTPPPSPPSGGSSVLDVKGFLETILGVSASDMQADTDLESLGLDSLTSIEVLHALKQSIGIDISPETFGECKTIQDFESLIATMMPRPSTPTKTQLPDNHEDTTELKKMLQMTSNPVSIQSKPGKNASLFLVHDGSGMCNYYKRLSSLERNTWGFYNPRFFDTQQWSGGLTEMAAAYAKEIQQTNAGPYILGGWSYGGAVAFEAARQLMKAGKKVIGVVLIDSPPPVDHQGLPAEVIAAVTKTAQSGSTNVNRQKIEALIKAQFENNTRNLVNYRPSSEGPNPKMVLLRSSEGYPTKGLGCKPHQWLENRSDVTLATKGWEGLTGEKLSVIDIPGNHFEPFEQKNVATVSASISEACRMLEA